MQFAEADHPRNPAPDSHARSASQRCSSQLRKQSQAMAAGESDATDQPLQAAVIADAVNMVNSEMLVKMQAIAESAERAAKAAEDAAESEKQRSEC